MTDSKKILYSLTFAIFCGIVPLHAQDSIAQNQPAKWSLQECLDYSAKNNYKLNTLRLSKRNSEQNLL